MHLAWLGTGHMGRPMAARLCSAGHAVAVWNRTAAKAASLEAVGARLAATPAEALAAAEGVFLMLADASAIEATLLGAADLDLRGRMVVQMGTIGPEESRKLGERLAARGAEYFEAPVLGSIPEAEAGTLLVLVGATPAQLGRWKEVLLCLGPPTYVGPVGQAASLKLGLNQLIAGLTGSFSFSLGLVRRSGVDVDLFMSILRQSALFAPTFDKKLARMRGRDFGTPNFPTRHLLKDMRLVLAEGRRLGLETAAVAALLPLLERAIDLGQADADYSALYQSIDPSGPTDS